MTEVSLKEHFEQLLAALDKRYEDRFAAQEQAIAVAERVGEKWRADANEWRTAMNDRERNFVSQKEFLALKERVDRHEGSGKGMEKLWGWIVAGVITAISAIGLFLRK